MAPHDLFLIPAASATAVSASLLALKTLVRVLGPSGTPPVSSSGIGLSILRYRVARLLCCIGLIALSMASSRRRFSTREGILILPYIYATALAALTVNPRKARNDLVGHVNFVLFTTLCVYGYRDILPLGTFTRMPQDTHEGVFLWAQIALLFFTAVVIPICTPNQYIPLDPANPQKDIHPEQTASILSFFSFSYLDRIILLAYSKSSLDEDEMHPLCDSDYAMHLVSRSFPHLDSFQGRNGQRHRHLFFGLMRVFYWEYLMMGFLLFLRVIANYSSPVAMNRLLQYIETQGQDAVVRPWVWIGALFFGPVISAVLFQLYISVAARANVQFEAIITQLVFTHSLRVRLKAEGAATEGEEPDAVAVSPEDDDSTTIQASSSSSEHSAATSDAGKKAETTKQHMSVFQPESSSSGANINSKADIKDLMILLIYVPFQLALGIWFLYAVLGWAAWVGLASIVLLAPVPGYMAGLVQTIQRERLKRTDGRVQSVSEAVNVLRMIKMFGWEVKMKDRIDDKRADELVWIRKRRIIDLASNLVNVRIFLALPLKIHEEYCTSTLVMKQPLNASKVFSTMTIFDTLRESISQVGATTASCSQIFLNISQMTEWLNTLATARTELLDVFDEKAVPVPSVEQEQIGFRNTTFAWSKETDDTRDFRLKIKGQVIFQRGRVNLVIGPTGSGKTSLLMALLGEMHCIPSSPDSWYNLPRAGGIAYAAQESWILNVTIRENITFDTPFDEERYRKVLYQCALEQDLSLFQAGDQTEVGEQGLTLSGGQRARLTLARAVYSTAEILLLDDVLAALDVHTAQWIVDKCFRGDLIQGRTVILVTHNIALTQPIADFVVTFGADGTVQTQGSVSEILKSGTLDTEKDQQKRDKELDSETATTDGKLIVAEEVQLGHVSARSFKMYFNALSNDNPILFFTCLVGGLFLSQCFVSLETWQLGYWARQYDERAPEDVNVVSGSKVIHTRLIDSVLRAPLRWLDTTPTSRIVARVTNDIRAVDEAVAEHLWPLVALLTAMLVRLIAIVIYAPAFFFPGVAVGVIGVYIGQVYISAHLAQLPVKRFMSNNRAPVLAHFGAAISGLVSIRAFGAQSKFGLESLSRIDRYTRAARNFYDFNRWVSIRIDVLGALFSAGLAAYLVYVKPISAGDTGFSINMAIAFTSMLLFTVRTWNRFEVQCNSLERIQAYIDIEHEKPATETGKPPAYWPASGDLRVENLTARYSEDSPEILHGLSFNVKSGERIGIVGRTGSGKSSLTLSLLRCILTEGCMVYDGIDTAELNLDALRSSITIIPQVPELLSGTLRTNLDPFGQYDDADLNAALRSAGLFALQSETEARNAITLDSVISVGGNNLSVGQRQILALARAIVRKSKILILDEATSAIDYRTDSIIQNSLRQELHGVSLLTVAHRLQTVMDADRIMVLDAGHIVEFDSPKKLLKIEGGKLRAMVDESRDREKPYGMANAN
ncbi:multidrug resistance-associated ABC transporter [Roridomyces roridus]|uniref:Multidrug resistance-associated ABC transporter n=1 Tax=Roridomyces roridus TaxID=1738132 RepID=A0AAD7FP01_9AGAR|nr:multidrug resistance-associated ABC transporter [Roridomyces roridus]